MKIAIVSDTHNRNDTVERALAVVRQRGIDTILHCGDIEDPPMVELFAGFKAHFVFGNCDWNRDELRSAMKAAGATLHENFGHLELEKRQIAFVHSDDKKLFAELEASDAFDYLFYGHTHVREEHRTGKTRVINPGALQRARPKSFAILDVATDNVEIVEVEG
jgi:putative phosphoesterase